MVYQLTRNFPADEPFGLTNQMRRAAVSISSSVAQGCSRASPTDYTRFVEIATGSVFEIVLQATIARSQGFLSEAHYQQLYQAAEKQSRTLSGLRNSLNSTNPQLSTLNRHERLLLRGGADPLLRGQPRQELTHLRLAGRFHRP